MEFSFERDELQVMISYGEEHHLGYITRMSSSSLTAILPMGVIEMTHEHQIRILWPALLGGEKPLVLILKPGLYERRGITCMKIKFSSHSPIFMVANLETLRKFKAAKKKTAAPVEEVPSDEEIPLEKLLMMIASADLSINPADAH